MPTLPDGKVAFAVLLFALIRNVFVAAPSFNTISTFLPSGVKKATLDRLSVKVEAMRTEPGVTNLDAWAMI